MKYAIISDIHEDIISFKQVMSEIKAYNVDKLVCLGDITGFSDMHHPHKETKDAEACINILKDNFEIIVAGNHDLNTLDKLPVYLERHNEAKSYLPKETWAYEGEIHATLSHENFKLLNKLPEYMIVNAGNFNILFSHFLFPDITGSTILIPEIRKELKPHFNFMEKNDCIISIVGHTHIDGYAITSGRYIQFMEYGFKKIAPKPQIIFCPAIVNNNQTSGFMIFDTDSFEMSIKKIENNNYGKETI